MSPLLTVLLHSLALAVRPSPAQADTPDTLTRTAVLEAAHTAEVCALIAAPVRQVRVQEEDQVHQADTLILLDSTELNLAAARAQLAYQQRQGFLDRAARLHAQGGLSAQDLESLRYEAESAHLRWDQALLELGRTVLCAPLSGQVAEVRAQAGRLTSAGQVLLVLIDPQDLKAELYLPASQLAQVRLHQPVRALPVTGPGRPLLGQVVHLSPILDPQSGQARVRLLFPHAGAWCRPGQVVQVEVTP